MTTYFTGLSSNVNAYGITGPITLGAGMVSTTVSSSREPRKIKNLTPTEAYKKTPCGAKGSIKLYIKMTELTQA
ncbi:hypothetical protein KBZ15_11760, partial [Cyanobium sp. BA20m-p-22]|uniref:hypothetical protein n=1 Tax=Cyanobium sp. BA20m-p-22 TaxID=2823704 RepID=UPI0020CE477B